MRRKGMPCQIGQGDALMHVHTSETCMCSSCMLTRGCNNSGECGCRACTRLRNLHDAGCGDPR